jgi:hypothetical protein
MKDEWKEPVVCQPSISDIVTGESVLKYVSHISGKHKIVVIKKL